MLRGEVAAQQNGALKKFLPESLGVDGVRQLLALGKKPQGSLGLLSSDGRFSACRSKHFWSLGRPPATVLEAQGRGFELGGWSECQEGKGPAGGQQARRMLRLVSTTHRWPLMGKTPRGLVLMRCFAGKNNRRSRLGFSGWRRAFCQAGMARSSAWQARVCACVTGDLGQNRPALRAPRRCAGGSASRHGGRGGGRDAWAGAVFADLEGGRTWSGRAARALRASHVRSSREKSCRNWCRLLWSRRL